MVFFFLMKQVFCSRAALEKHLGRKQLISTSPRVTGGRVHVLQPFQHPSRARRCRPNRDIPNSRVGTGATAEMSSLPVSGQARREKKLGFVFPTPPSPLAF